MISGICVFSIQRGSKPFIGIGPANRRAGAQVDDMCAAARAAAGSLLAWIAARTFGVVVACL
jgi:hypothetical protein